METRVSKVGKVIKGPKLNPAASLTHTQLPTLNNTLNASFDYPQKKRSGLAEVKPQKGTIVKQGRLQAPVSKERLKHKRGKLGGSTMSRSKVLATSLPSALSKLMEPKSEEE